MIKMNNYKITSSQAGVNLFSYLDNYCNKLFKHGAGFVVPTNNSFLFRQNLLLKLGVSRLSDRCDG